ncbi:MAG TPA: TadE family protein [Arthrobacter sp.]|nr:TadE family protein [Arthrobacter sp.]
MGLAFQPLPCRSVDRERGSAVVDFVLVGSLLTVIFIAIIQLALVLHVRNTLIDAAASGARYASLADRGAADAKSRTEALISMALNDSYARNVSVDRVTHQGLETIEVNVEAPLPVIGLIGPVGVVEVSGHAVTTN